MSLLEKIIENIVRIADEFSKSAVLCSLMMAVFSLFSIIGIRNIVSGLFEMHRSKSALKKIRKKYSAGQRLLLKHAWQECLHSKRFCRRLVVLHHCVLCLFVIEILLALLSNIWSVLMPIIAWYNLAFIVCISFPVCLMNFILDRYPLQKWKHEFKFKKYHNTSDHESLW